MTVSPNVSPALRLSDFSRVYVPCRLGEVPGYLAAGVDYLLDAIFVGRGLWNVDQQGYTPLNAQALKAVVRDYKRASDWLAEHRLIEINRQYVPGEKSRGYRWADDYETAEQRPADPGLVKRLEQRQAARLRTLKPVHRHLYRWLTETRFDLPAAKTHAEGLGMGEVNITPGELIHDRRWMFEVCEYGRVHTPITRLDKRLRKFLRVGDGAGGLVNIDVVNSQPLILAIKLRALFNDSSTPPLPLYAGKSQVSAGFSGTSEPWASAGKLPLPPDVREYIRLCQEGRFYERLMEESGIVTDDASRGPFKEELFAKIFYGRANERWAVSRLFKRMFPNVWAAIAHLKRRDHRTFSHAMQRAESGIMIGGVCKRLMQDHPTLPILTIHDSILTTAAHVETIQAVMRAEFSRYGLSPLLRVERTA